MKQKQGISNALGLPSIEELKEITKNTLYDIGDVYDNDDNEETDSPNYTEEQIKLAIDNMNTLKEYRKQLKDIPDITARKAQLEKLASIAESKFEDVFQRGFNCEDRFMADVINAANALLKMALEAHSKVIDSDIKLIDMQIKKDKMEIDINMKNNTNIHLGDEQPAETSDNITRAGRNELLNRRKKNK